jgi:hypothetical protein
MTTPSKNQRPGASWVRGLKKFSNRLTMRSRRHPRPEKLLRRPSVLPWPLELRRSAAPSYEPSEFPTWNTCAGLPPVARLPADGRDVGRNRVRTRRRRAQGSHEEDLYRGRTLKAHGDQIFLPVRPRRQCVRAMKGGRASAGSVRERRDDKPLWIASRQDRRTSHGLF